MSNLILKKITLVSFLEKKARRIPFHPNITVIQGDNHTGKSSLIKSIYWTFGTEPQKIHPNWKKAEPISVVEFTIDSKDYMILRKKDFYAVFDEHKNLIERFDNVTTGLGPFLAKMLNYHVVLNNKKNEPITPPPAYFFLPFYIDQDVSWKDNWQSFERLGQIENWRDPIINYHTGIRPNEYYITKSQIDIKSKEVNELEEKNKVNKSVMKKLMEQFKEVSIDIDIEVFKREIEEMMAIYQGLNSKGEELKKKIVDLSNQKIHIESQISIVNKSIKELQLDYSFSVDQDDLVECPTCGQVYENSFAERFAIAKDEDRCQDLLLTLQEELLGAEIKIKNEYNKYNETNQESSDIMKLLERKKEEIKFQDVIQNEGKKELKNILQKEIDELSTQIVTIEVAIKELREELKTYEDKIRQEDIKKLYLQNMNTYLDKLEIYSMAQETYKAITSRIRENGSGLPRALLAYYYSILNVMKTYSTATYCPIIIDSPNQQDQSHENLAKMMKMIFEEKPKDSQLILGLVELGDYQFEGEIINLDEKHSFLKKSEYDLLSKEVRALLDICYTP